MIKANRFDPAEIVKRFDEYLTKNKTHFEAVVVGAGALTLMKILNRRTIDIDILDPKIPPKIKDLAAKFRIEMETEGISMEEHWINNGADFLLEHLPKGWRKRTQTFYKGKGLTLHTIGRADQIKTKLWGFCHLRGHDKDALIALKTTLVELDEAQVWVLARENTPFWPEIVERHVNEIRKALAI